ncbi:TetR/AcrR family transcriptional regulator [Nocardia wallacei]|uniref:TetR family transcriptional regulator n=1 Tax=Nocardia wallacei TaxID=480035 RepID=A0A7G1KDQ2_9NOCA|nr:TetR/AcrR family transcriptional regulator C-terminal domain-containing protein [Nocardia wallacei]BCK53362.1 TetR family transcriptional regulator [Nocardia wallacei]
MSASSTLDLLWGSPQRPKRGPKPSLTLERIVGEAITLADAEGLANLSMQRLAERLGCAKMALYRYVPGKTELTALMLDAAMGAPPPPAPAAHAWRDDLRAWSETIFDRMLAHPWALELSNGVRPMGPNEIAWLESALAALAESPLTGAERLDTVVLLLGHVRSLVQQIGPADADDDLESRLAEQIGQVMAAHAERFPHVVAAFADQAADPAAVRNDALTFGIDRILDGIAALIADRAR